MSNYHWYDYTEGDPIGDIEDAKKLYVDQLNRVKREEKVRDLLLEDYVRTVRAHRSRYDYINIIRDAQKQKDNKLKKERPQFETVRSFILDDFFGGDKKFKLTNIVSCGYETYGWQFELSGYGKTVDITIPVMANITTENIKYAYDGMFSFSVEESKHVWNVMKKSYKIEDIAAFIKEYFDPIRNSVGDKEET